MQAPSKQHGIALYIVLIVILIGLLLVVFAARTALFHEAITGNEADYQKTFEAAKILMQDAESDILHSNPQGGICQDDGSGLSTCKRNSAIRFPANSTEMAELLIYLDSLPTGCLQGICRKRSGIQDFWSDPQILLKMTAVDVGVRYGQFTGASSDSGGNTLLAIRSIASKASELKGAWYWIEILPFADAGVGLLSNYETNIHLKTLAPDKSRPWIYRITVFARGQRNGTEVVLQSLVSLQSVE